jgi:hypothetical protein
MYSNFTASAHTQHEACGAPAHGMAADVVIREVPTYHIKS